MKLGQLKDRIELFTRGAPIDDGMATVDGPPVSQGKRWAKFIHRSVNETFKSAGVEADAVALFLVRRDSLTKTIKPTWTLSYDGNFYDVIGTSKWKRDGILIQAKAGD